MTILNLDDEFDEEDEDELEDDELDEDEGDEEGDEEEPETWQVLGGPACVAKVRASLDFRF